mgnify:CR=1 FL=1
MTSHTPTRPPQGGRTTSASITAAAATGPRRATRRSGGLRPLAWAALLASGLAGSLHSPQAHAATRYWLFPCTGGDWPSIACWSATFGGLPAFAAPTASDDAFLLAPGASSPQMVTLALPSRQPFLAQARDLKMYGNASFAAGLNMDSQTLSVRNLTVGAASSSFLGQMNQSGGATTVADTLRVSGGGYQMSGGLLNAQNLVLHSAGAAATFTQTGGRLGATTVSIGSDHNQAASFTQLAGRVDSANLNIGTGVLTSGALVSLSGAGSQWANADLTVVGSTGHGVLQLAGGAVASTGTAVLGVAPASTGRVTVQGAGSDWQTTGLLTVGAAGSGLLQASTGGHIGAASIVLNGFVDGPDAGLAATVAGAGSTLTASESLLLGRTRGARLSVLDQAAVSSRFTVVGENTGLSSSVQLGDRTRLSSSVSLVVGDAGRGELLATSGSTIESGAASIGQFAGSIGLVTLSGNGTHWSNANLLTVGQAGSGELRLSDGASLASFAATVGQEGSGTGLLALGGAATRMDITDTLALGAGTAGGIGKLEVAGGATVATGRLVLAQQAGGTVGWLTANLGARIAADQFVLGLGGHGLVELFGGSVIDAGTTTLAKEAGSNGTLGLRDAGTRFTSSGPMMIGTSGAAFVQVAAGAQMQSPSGQMALVAGSSADVQVTGLGSLWQMQGDLDVGLGGQALLKVASQGTVAVGGTTRIGANGFVVLDGGTLRTATSALGNMAQMDWRSGALHITGVDGARLDDVALPSLLSLGAGRELRVDQTLSLGPNSTLLLSGGRLRAGTLALDNAVLASTAGGAYALNMSDIGLLSGQGQVAASISGGSVQSRIAATGPLTLGLAARTDGFYFVGHLDVGSQQVVLLDRDLADLGALTTLADGGRLASVNGVRLLPGDVMRSDGSASVQGTLVNVGDVHAATGHLDLLGPVRGSGSFAGDVRFLAGYEPGNSTAEVNFHGGNVSFGPYSVLTMEVNGTQAGSEHDRLFDIGTLTFQGTLSLVFGSGFDAPQGATLSLFDFDSFIGRIDAGNVRVTGFDASRLDLSHLGVDGTLRVTAVPEPASWGLMLAGLLGLGGWRRRRAACRV